MQRRNLLKWACVALFLLGLLVLCTPLLHSRYVSAKQSGIVTQYLQQVYPPSLPTTEETQPSREPEPQPIAHADLLADMTAYNQEIWKQRQSGLCSTWAYETPSFYLPDYGFRDEAFGVLSIPKMDLQMPIYLGATWQHMADGVAQLSQTSLPIGGRNTNCVIAGHRGWCGAPYFREITVLEAGDLVYLQNPWQTLRYRVCDIQIIAPNDVQAIHIRPGRDLLTLLTCHPYASGGQQRYLVICEADP